LANKAGRGQGNNFRGRGDGRGRGGRGNKLPKKAHQGGSSNKMTCQISGKGS
jgi:hypothetical protein